mmetsp:Transcript_9245/g.29766  ORF Transcript_9245/g.29766 Transcript_9245/m.29766 type:complete len:307 (+) Transcript_9245:340-1260(+)
MEAFCMPRVMSSMTRNSSFFSATKEDASSPSSSELSSLLLVLLLLSPLRHSSVSGLTFFTIATPLNPTRYPPLTSSFNPSLSSSSFSSFFTLSPTSHPLLISATTSLKKHVSCLLSPFICFISACSLGTGRNFLAFTPFPRNPNLAASVAAFSANLVNFLPLVSSRHIGNASSTDSHFAPLLFLHTNTLAYSSTFPSLSSITYRLPLSMNTDSPLNFSSRNALATCASSVFIRFGLKHACARNDPIEHFNRTFRAYSSSLLLAYTAIAAFPLQNSSLSSSLTFFFLLLLFPSLLFSSSKNPSSAKS